MGDNEISWFEWFFLGMPVELVVVGLIIAALGIIAALCSSGWDAIKRKIDR